MWKGNWGGGAFGDLKNAKKRLLDFEEEEAEQSGEVSGSGIR